MKKTKLKLWIAFTMILLVFLLSIFLRKKTELVQPKIGPITDSVYSLGTIKSDATYNLRTVISSRILTLFVSEGDHVEKNKPLIYLESGLTLYAPFTGVISNINIRQGEITMPSQTLLTLINFDKMYILASLDQQSILMVRKGQKVEISFESMRNKKAKGVVASVYPSNSSFMAKIITREMPAGVLPEMTCDLAIETSRKENAVLIPTVALNQKKTILVARNKEKIMMKPQLGNTSGDYIEILGSEIQPNDRFIVVIPKSPLWSLFQLISILSLILILSLIFRKKKEAQN